ncbi:Glyoxylate reductase [Hyphomicrobiales bacterium]|nr:Glyoxylate reductase [Hyphomicrobiales bacterium]CAH1676795.1 Glyoxylate reductase [Hyphomicrobiales bacterium]
MEKRELLVVGSRPDWYLDRLASHFSLHHLTTGDPADLDGDVAARIEALTSSGALSASLLNALPRLRLVANGGAGYERIDTGALRDRRIHLTNTPDVTDGCVADMAFALLLAVGRHIASGDAFVRSGKWETSEYPLVPRMHGRTLGILGLGRIGLAIARRAAGFDMPVVYHNRRPRTDVNFEYCGTARELASRSDFLIVACPGGAATHHIVDASVLEALGPKGLIVNIARGSIIDESALVAALKNGVIGGAGLDVFEHEPRVPSDLLTARNVVLMPHRGGGTFETWEDACDLVIANVSAFFENRPLPTPVL